MKRNYYNGQDFWNEKTKYKRIEYPINDEIIKRAEDILSIKFPQSLIDLMKIQNGGEINYRYFILPSGVTGSIHSIEPIHFEKDDISILSSLELLKEVDGLSKELIVLWTDFHCWLVLDYRNRKDNPPILYIEEDFSASSNETTDWEYFKIADTFEEFLKKLFR
ncbi:hypothetical protein GCM10007380_15220 [Gottfriedia solisilvae]|uniref:Knr4/Smi1-like domain-containing protein n=1 Tax=Gottfriedia solisilvae TaxID=1516104 RepID=A0A8J3AFF1_9BACI|nr:hypothetical protein GCM10007380_15220 [Gottfriedia solisilvae]